jgi:Uma2 family endonuclease
MTEDEFVRWSGDEHHGEWVDGEVIVMSPDSIKNLEIAGFLTPIFDAFANSKSLGRVFSQRAQLRFASLRRRREPDIVFVSKHHEAIIKTNHVEGAPDLIVEIVSAESTARDYREKYNEYETAGVREYWIVDPLRKQVEVHALGRNKRYAQIQEKNGAIHSLVLPGLYIKPDWLWQSPLPSWLGILRELGVLK